LEGNQVALRRTKGHSPLFPRLALRVRYDTEEYIPFSLPKKMKRKNEEEEKKYRNPVKWNMGKKK